ncbi:glycosyltransferase family 2 protein, partial [Streptomyces parvus]|nr:glycosyltransferase family 2 protein [Streptomyces parvus]
RSPGDVTATEPATDGTGTRVLARLPVPAAKAKKGVRVYLDVAGRTYEIPVRTEGRPMPLARRWGETEPHRVAAWPNTKGRLVITTGPLRERGGRGTRLWRALGSLGSERKRSG